MSKHTPGPWHISTSGKFIRKNDGPYWPDWNICELNMDHTEATANGHLIAAAPALLEACEAAANWIARFGEHAPIIFGGEAELSELLRAAIVRAKGGAK